MNDVYTNGWKPNEPFREILVMPDRSRVHLKEDTPIITGYQIYHNYLRPHEALEGKTPAEACGIQVKGENKWITLIQNAGCRQD